MKKKRIFVFGNFGYKTNQLDGQTVKTRNIYNLLKKHENELGPITYYDTQEFKYKKSSIFKFLNNLFTCNKLVIIPAGTSLTYIFPIVFLLSKILRYEIIHIGVGGWQDNYFRRNRMQRRMAKNIKANLVQNKSVRDQLFTKFGFKNANIIPNFRIHNYKPKISNIEGKLRIVYMSRIEKKKGLDVIFNIANKIILKHPNGSITIDFYGQVKDEDKNYFYENIAKYDFIKYCGELSPASIYSTLSAYDILILPTRYYTEGFPGAVQDAYISGIPVLVSNWKFANEFVEHGVSGYICDVNNINHFIEIIEKLLFDKKTLNKLKQGAYKQSKKYSENKAYNILKEYLHN